MTRTSKTLVAIAASQSNPEAIDQDRRRLLTGAALDYTAYASLVARLRVLRELMDFIDERNDALNKGDPVDED